MSLAAGWYAVAVAEDIEPGTSAGTQLDGRELVIWRDRDGASHVWEDRCPHRGMRLSFGFVRGNHIACLYHGWQYDAAGQCRAIPAHPDLVVPETIRVPTYPSAETAGLIHVWSEPAPAAGAELAGWPGARGVRSVHVDLRPAGVAAGLATRLEARGAGLFAGRLGGADVLVFLQPFTAERTALHLAIEGPGDPAAVSAAAAALRDELEAAG